MNKAQEYYRQGLAFEKAGDKMEALKYYRASAREDSSFRPAFNNLGAIYSELGKPDLALGFYKQALELGADAAVLFNMAGECFRLEKYTESEGFLKKALQIDRRMLRAHILLAYIYGKIKDYKKAEIYFKNVLTLEKNNRMAHLGLCVLYSETGRLEEALKIADEFLKTAPSDETFVNLRGGLLLQTGKVDESLEIYQELSKKSEKFTSFTSHLEAAKNDENNEYEKLFSGMKDKIKERNIKLKQKIEKRKKEKESVNPEGHKDDMKDLVDLSLLHLFNGDSEKALKYLFQAKKVNQNRQIKQ